EHEAQVGHALEVEALEQLLVVSDPADLIQHHLVRPGGGQPLDKLPGSVGMWRIGGKAVEMAAANADEPARLLGWRPADTHAHLGSIVGERAGRDATADL